MFLRLVDINGLIRWLDTAVSIKQVLSLIQSFWAEIIKIVSVFFSILSLS